ncbi:hypothetical protein WEI85_30840 [Actinomycetes bacterium KLBMP 9797]
MKKLTIRVAVMGVVGVAGVLGVSHAPAQAAWPQPCSVDGMSLYGRYPIHHDQRVYQCAPDPFTPRWVYSETCPDGTLPHVVINGNIAQTTCVAA